MSFNNPSDNFSGNVDASSGRREGFNDTRGGVESYGQGTGSGAYDPANTGLGGYGSSGGGGYGSSGGYGGGYGKGLHGFLRGSSIVSLI